MRPGWSLSGGAARVWVYRREEHRLVWRPSHGRTERYTDLAGELVRLKVDVIIAPDNPTIAAAQKATKTIPIVMILAMDPVATGFVGSLARPGAISLA